MKCLVPLPTAFLVLMVLHSSTGPFTYRSTPSLLCGAAYVMVGDDSTPVEVPRRSLWELSVVWDKLGHFMARLWHGHHDEDDDCEKIRHPFPEMTSLSANETATTLVTHNDSAPVTTHRHLLKEVEKEHSKEAELRALKMVQISRARDVTSHERLWATVTDDDDMEDEKKDDEGYANQQTITTGPKPVLVGDIVEHYSSLSTVLQDIPDDEDPDTYARNMEKPYQESTLAVSEAPSYPKPGDHTRSPDHPESVEHTRDFESDDDNGKIIYMTSFKTETGDVPTDQAEEFSQDERGHYADDVHETHVSSPHHQRQLFIHPEDFKLHAHKHDKDGEDDNVGPYYSKDSGLWRRKFKGPKTPQGFPLPDSTSEGHYHHIHQHQRQLREQARANMSEIELAQIQEEAREELVQALRLAARDAEAQRTDLSVGNSLESVMNALAVRRPPVPGFATGTPVVEAKQQNTKEPEQVRLPGDGMQPEVDNPLPPGRERRRLRGLQQAGAAPGAGVGAVLAGTFTEAQKAELRQMFYDAALSMMREAARQALNTNQGGSNGDGSNGIFPSANGNDVGSNVVNQDAYTAALNAMINAVGSKEVNTANGGIASHSGGPGGQVDPSLQEEAFARLGPLGPIIQGAAGAIGDTAAATTATTAGTAKVPEVDNMGNPTLDLEALAGLLQHQFVPAVPGGMGEHTHKPDTAPQTDASGNVVTHMMGPLEVGRKKQEKGKEREEEKTAKDKKEKKDEEENERPGLGDAFYDRVSSQLMSHSARNFQKMQDAVGSIMAQEGIMTWEDGMEGLGE
eukprot:evm.model.NODE_49178_length_15246_cov_28.421749.1